MIRLFWRWLVGDPDHEILWGDAEKLADALDAMTNEQKANAFLNHPEMWQQANAVAASVWLKRGHR